MIDSKRRSILTLEKTMPSNHLNVVFGAIRSCLIVAAIYLVCSSLPVYADTYPRQPGIQILRYTFDVTLGDASDELTVKDTVELKFLVAGVGGIDLDLCSRITSAPVADRFNPCLVPTPRAPRGGPPNSSATATVSSVGRGMTVTNITATHGESLRYTHAKDRLHVEFAAPSKAGERVSFTISYHGIPATGLFIGQNRYNDRGFFTDNWPNKAHNWLATIDHISVKAAKTIRVTAPAKYHVISNGKMTEETDLGDGLRRTEWTEEQPVPSWQYSLAVSTDGGGTVRLLARCAFLSLGISSESRYGFQGGRSHDQIGF